MLSVMGIVTGPIICLHDPVDINTNSIKSIKGLCRFCLDIIIVAFSQIKILLKHKIMTYSVKLLNIYDLRKIQLKWTLIIFDVTVN